ncbi:MAG: AbrB/MazE/SpoVT family DNA-binding domain-containing protein [Promethearchaeota archaeon]
MANISTVSDKGLTTIPKDIRKKLNIKKGDKIHWILTGKDESELIIVKDPLKYLTGRYSREDITHEKVEHEADKLIKKEVENKYQ